MRALFYLLACIAVYPLALIFEYGCRFSDRTARHAKPLPPAVKAVGRHRAGSPTPEEATT